MVPWIVANPGVQLSEVAERFGVKEADLLKDLDVVWMVGLPPYSPDSLVEVVLEEGKVWIHYADFFSRPLRLSPAQGLALLASSEALLSMPGTDPDGPLARALAKLAAALGMTPDDTIDVDLGTAEAAVLAQLRTAVAEGTEVEIDYYSYGRDDHAIRRIAPWRVSASGGAWYVEGWCQRANGERIFRLDRISSLSPTGEVSAHRPDDSGHDVVIFHPGPADPRVTLQLEPEAAWVAEAYPSESVSVGEDGSIEVSLVVTAVPWLERLLVRLGPLARVVDSGELSQGADLAHIAACRILERYRS